MVWWGSHWGQMDGSEGNLIYICFVEWDFPLPPTELLLLWTCLFCDSWDDHVTLVRLVFVFAPPTLALFLEQ